jgi:Sulfotransferase family
MAVARADRAGPAGGRLPGDRPAGPAAFTGPASSAPVVVLAPAYCGASALRSLLAGHPDLACTTSTGLLLLCEQAMATWQNADRRPSGQPSALATAATRALASAIITSILVREGKPRWAEIAAPSPRAAATFLGLYSQTRFVCLYRACPGAISAALDASPWGITDPVLAPFTAAYPASTVASLTAYWVTATGSLLAFEREHPQSCLRVRYEDLARAQHQTTENMMGFLGLARNNDHAVSAPGTQPQPAPQDTSPEADIPVHLIPPGLLAQANDLLRQLSYPALPAPRRSDSTR